MVLHVLHLKESLLYCSAAYKSCPKGTSSWGILCSVYAIQLYHLSMESDKEYLTIFYILGAILAGILN